MGLVPARELRNHTADVIRRAQNGEDLTITVNGVPAATLLPIRPGKKAFLTTDELLALRPATPDLTLEHDLRELTDDTTDDLGPIE